MEQNQIYLGDAAELIKSLPNKSVDLIVTDPPYLGNYAGGGGNLTSLQYADRIRSSGLYGGYDLKILSEFVRVLKKINIYIWCSRDQIYEYITYFVKTLKCNWEMLIWHKTNPPPFVCGHYLKDKEYCLYFWETGVHLFPQYDKAKTVYSTPLNQKDGQLYGHPTIKNIDIIRNLITNSSEENDVVLDPFIGSGTTAVACKQLGRNYIGFEINEEYYKIATDRLKGITKLEREYEAEQIKLF